MTYLYSGITYISDNKLPMTCSLLDEWLYEHVYGPEEEKDRITKLSQFTFW